MLLSSHINSSSWQETICMQFIDPYGDAVFNQRQVEVLVREVEASVSSSKDKEVRAHLQRVIKLLRDARGRIHTYVWFVGD